ncbi:MAG: hypothetical protein U9O95_03685 [Candidatus Marinimicrobia bacterium]|nr:hypothetical protein [Candidatus Neomarinimicrobiota bacterium]
MRPFRSLMFLILFCTGMLHAVVGDWVSYGSQLTLKDLHISGNTLRSSSHGGMVMFNIENETFSTEHNINYLEHIDILRYYVNPDGSEWFSYASGVNGISYRIPEGYSGYFDFEFVEASAFVGNENHVLAVYMNDFAPEIAHFVKNNNRFVFQDTYNQFPETPGSIYDIALVNDSIYLATDKGLIKSWLYHANLKPESAWKAIGLDSSLTVHHLCSMGDSLYFINGDHDLYNYHNGVGSKIMEGNEPALAFYTNGNELIYATQSNIHDVFNTSNIYNSDHVLSSFTLRNDTLWVSEENRGLSRIILSSGSQKNFIPNTMLYMKANALAITDDQQVVICGLEGISLLDGNTWHNLVFSRSNESLNNERNTDQYSGDTLNIAYRIGGQTTVYDAMVSSQGELFCSITDVSIYKYGDQLPGTEGPGALQRIQLNDLSQYTVYDTSNSVIDGTQGLGGGTSYYLMNRGLAEDKYGNIWALNVHTLAGETLLKFKTNGELQKFSIEGSGNTLQILAREMAFDNYGRLWIANEARQSDEPRTTGGITIYDQLSGVWGLITTSDGLISNNIYSIDMDPLTGNMWVATASGVQMIRTPTTFGPTTEFSMNPPIDGLSGMVPVKLRIDPKGNKWILTQSQGVQIYLTNNRWFDDGNGLSTNNSRLLDDVIYDLVFDKKNGYAYLLTASGLSRYEIAWTEERISMDDIIVFPQPFRPGTDTYLAIDGLAEQSQVRISTLDGRVLIQFSANAEQNLEKQIVWDGILPNGEYIPRGIYLAFITNIDGLKATIKFAVE